MPCLFQAGDIEKRGPGEGLLSSRPAHEWAHARQVCTQLTNTSTFIYTFIYALISVHLYCSFTPCKEDLAVSTIAQALTGIIMALSLANTFL